jgi:hypothetical protein
MKAFLSGKMVMAADVCSLSNLAHPRRTRNFPHDRIVSQFDTAVKGHDFSPAAMSAK